MLPDEGGLFFLAHATAVRSPLLGFLGGPTTTLLAPFVALAFEAVFDGTHPVQEELVDFLDDMEDAKLMLDLRPIALQRVLIKRRAVSNAHLGVESATFEGV